MSDAVNNPRHYTSDPSGIECIEVTRHRNFNVGNAIKYLWRAGLKGDAPKGSDAQDLNKAIWYICDEIGRLGGKLTAKHILFADQAHEMAVAMSEKQLAADLVAFDGVLLDAFGVLRFEEIQLRFVDHIPNVEVVIPLMKAVGGRWRELLTSMQTFTAEQKAKATGAGVGAEYVKEAEKAVERA